MFVYDCIWSDWQQIRGRLSPELLSGSFIAGTIRLLSTVLCSFSRKREVEAICRSASIPSCSFLFDGLCDLDAVDAGFGCKCSSELDSRPPSGLGSP